MAQPMTQLACHCGAVYEVIPTQGPCRTQDAFKCVLCNKELVCWIGSDVAQFRLIKAPEQDRE